MSTLTDRFLLLSGLISDEGLVQDKYIKRRCTKNQTKSVLEKEFQNVKITNHNINKYRQKSQDICIEDFKKLNEVVIAMQKTKLFSTLQNKLYPIIYRSYVNKENPELELFVNLIIFLSSFLVSWSDFMIAFPQGQKMLKDLFQKRDAESILNLYLVIQNVYLTQAYDQLFFRKEMFNLLPFIDVDSVSRELILKAIDKGSAVVLQKTLKYILDKK